MEIPILSGIIAGLKVFFRTRRYVAYLIVFVATTFLALFVSWLLTLFAGTFVEDILVRFFVYVGATGTIYFAIGTVLTGLGADNLWITRRGRGKVTELKGVVWFSVSFAISVFLSLIVGQLALLFFSMFCWVGWIAFQAYLSSRTSLRLASIIEPKKGGIALASGSFIILLVGLGVIAAQILLPLVILPNNLFGIGDMLGTIFTNYAQNIIIHWDFLVVAAGLLGLFAAIMFFSFFRYARKGTALNISLLTLFIAVYSGYFLVNVLRRMPDSPPTMTVVDIAISLFFLAYAMSGIGRTLTDAVEESRTRLRDFGPVLTFFLASGFFYVDSIIAVTATGGSALGQWFLFDWDAGVTYATFLFRDIAKLIAFPIVAILTSLYYLLVERTDRIVTRARETGDTFEFGEVDEEIMRKAPPAGEPWPSERAEGIKKGKPGHKLSSSDPHRLTVDDSRRLKKKKRLNEEED